MITDGGGNMELIRELLGSSSRYLLAGLDHAGFFNSFSELLFKTEAVDVGN